MSAYETRPNDLLIESPEIPGLWWNMRTGFVCNKDGRPLTMDPNMPAFPPMTNDPQAGYGAEQREPLTPHWWILEKFGIRRGMTFTDPSVTLNQCAGWISEWVAMKITSGELMVSKTASLTDTDVDDITWWACTECNTNVGEGVYQPKWKFCPGCGAKIVE